MLAVAGVVFVLKVALEELEGVRVGAVVVDVVLREAYYRGHRG